MGSNHSSHQARRRPSSQQDFTNFINQKEYVFIAMQSDVDRAFAQKNHKHIEDLAGEIVAHIMDLKQVPLQNLNHQESDRVRKLIYSFEISFAKLKSVYSCDTSFLKKKKEVPTDHSGNSNFYSDPVEPDLVSDITRSTEIEDQVIQRRKAPPIPTSPRPENANKSNNGVSRQASVERQSLPNSSHDFRSLPIHRQSLPNTEANTSLFHNYENSDVAPEIAINEIEHTYQQFATRASKPVRDINEYYQMDKTVFFLYTQLSKLIISKPNPTLEEKKAKLLKELVDFRGFLGKKAAEFREIEDAIGILDELIYANDTQDSRFNTIKSERIPEVPVTDLDESPYSKIDTSPEKDELTSRDENSEETNFKIAKIESAFESIKSKAFKPVANVSEYYVIDVELSNLHTDLKSVETKSNTDLQITKTKLLDSIVHFKELLDKKVSQFEEIRRIEDDLNTLTLVFDSCPPNEFKNLKEKAEEIQQRINTTTFFKNFEHKKDLFTEKVNSVLDQINLVESEALVDRSFEPIYGNFGNLEKPSMSSFEIIDKDEIKVPNIMDQENSEDENEPIYSNFEEIRQGITHQDLASINSTNTEVPIDRDSLYSNIDIVKENLRGSTQKLVDSFEEQARKPPRPLPRNYEEKLINGLPKQWKRLNEICENGKLSQKEVAEVENIKQQLEMTRNLFQRKIEKIFENFEESVDL